MLTLNEGSCADCMPSVVGIPFRLERDLVRDFERNLTELLCVKPTHVACTLREPTVGSVIPDILVGTWHRRHTLRTSRLTFVEASVLACVQRHGPLTPSTLLATIHLSTRAADKVLSKLLMVGAVTQLANGCLAITSRQTAPWLSLLAFEAKLRRWKEALDQAKIYLRFANRAFVVLDEATTTLSAPMSAAFVSAGVGLYLQSRTSTRLVIKARVHMPRGVDRTLAVQKVASWSAASEEEASEPRVGSPTLIGG